MKERRQTRAIELTREDEDFAWDHYCRTGCIIPGYTAVIAREMKERRIRADRDRDERS